MQILTEPKASSEDLSLAVCRGTSHRRRLGNSRRTFSYFSATRTLGRSAFRCKNVFDDLRHFGFSRHLRARSRHDRVFRWGVEAFKATPPYSLRVPVVGCVVITVIFFFAVAFASSSSSVRLLSEHDIGTRRVCV
jgi:hypothetical protein